MTDPAALRYDNRNSSDGMNTSTRMIYRLPETVAENKYSNRILRKQTLTARTDPSRNSCD